MGNPTKKPRINLAVDPEIYETITEMAELQGTARATLVMDLLRSVHPVLVSTVEAMKAVRTYEGTIPDYLADSVASDLAGVSRYSKDQLDLLRSIGEKLSDRPEEGADADACPSGRS